MFYSWINSIDFEFATLLESLKKLNAASIGLIIILAFFDLFLRVIKFKYILKFFKYDLGIKKLYKIFFIGFFSGVLTPMKLGEASKALYLKKSNNMPLTLGIFCVILERLFELLALFILLIVALLKVDINYNLNIILIYILTLLIIFLSFSILYLDNSIIKKLLIKNQIFIKKIYNNYSNDGILHVTNFIKNIDYIVRIKYIFIWLILSITILLVDFLIPYVLFIDFQNKLPLSNIIFGSIIGTLVSILSQTPGGLISFEGTTTYLYSQFGSPPEIALSVILISRLFTFYIFMIIGWIYFITDREML